MEIQGKENTWLKAWNHCVVLIIVEHFRRMYWMEYEQMGDRDQDWRWNSLNNVLCNKVVPDESKAILDQSIRREKHLLEYYFHRNVDEMLVRDEPLDCLHNLEYRSHVSWYIIRLHEVVFEIYRRTSNIDWEESNEPALIFLNQCNEYTGTIGMFFKKQCNFQSSSMWKMRDWMRWRCSFFEIQTQLNQSSMEVVLEVVVFHRLMMKQVQVSFVIV